MGSWAAKDAGKAQVGLVVTWRDTVKLRNVTDNGKRGRAKRKRRLWAVSGRRVILRKRKREVRGGDGCKASTG